MGIFFFIIPIVDFAKVHKSVNVMIALAEQSKSCLEISSVKKLYKVKDLEYVMMNVGRKPITPKPTYSNLFLEIIFTEES